MSGEGRRGGNNDRMGWAEGGRRREIQVRVREGSILSVRLESGIVRNPGKE